MIEVSWFVQGHAIFVKAVEGLHRADLTVLTEAIIRMMNTVESGEIHVLIDESVSDSASFASVSRIARFVRHTENDWLVVFGADNRFLEFMTAIISCIGNRHLPEAHFIH